MGLCVLHACRSLGGQKWAGPLELESEMQAKPRSSVCAVCTLDCRESLQCQLPSYCAVSLCRMSDGKSLGC